MAEGDAAHQRLALELQMAEGIVASWSRPVLFGVDIVGRLDMLVASLEGE